MQKLNAAAAYAVAFVLTVFAVTFWIYDGGPFRSPGSNAEMTRASVPAVKSTKAATINRLVLRGG